jgi:hypothetical protein
MRSRSRFLTAGAALLLFVIPCVAGGDRGAAPRFQSLNPHRSAPLWISAEDALTADGRSRAGVIAPAEENSLLRALAHDESKTNPQAAECGVTLGSTLDFAPGMEIPQSWDDVRKRARGGVVISGVVVESRIGLYAGAPATLLRIDPARSNRALPYDAYLLYPQGSMVINGVRVCTSDPGFAEIPVLGDRVLFVANQALDVSGTLFGPPAELIFYERAARFVPSPAAKSRALVPFKAFDELARALLEPDARKRER